MDAGIGGSYERMRPEEAVLVVEVKPSAYVGPEAADPRKRKEALIDLSYTLTCDLAST